MSKYSIEQLQAALVQADAAGDTQSAQVLADQIAAQRADYYVKVQPKQEESLWTDFVHGAGELADSLLHEGVVASPATSELMARSEAAGIHPQGATADALRGKNALAALTPEPTGVMGTLVSMVPSMALAVPGWEAGADALAESALPKAIDTLTARSPALQWVTQKLTQGAAGTLGSDITTGENPDNALAGGAGNVLAETLFHTPKALVFMKGLLAKNDADILAAADHIGVTPTVGMVTGRKWLTTLENTLSKVPGAGNLGEAYAKTHAGMSAFVDQLKTALGHNPDSSETGRDILEAVKAYTEKFKTDANEAYDYAFQKLPQHTKFNANKLADTIGEMKARYTHESLSNLMDSPVVKEIYNIVQQMPGGVTQGGRKKAIFSITEGRALLQRINEAIGSGMDSAFKNMSESDLSRLADALSEDISRTFEAHGHGKMWQQIQSRYAAGRAIIDEAQKVLGNARWGDEVYSKLFGNQAGAFKPIGADSIIALKAAMPLGDVNKLAGEIVHRMGLESAGNAGAGGREFNAATFLTNWNKLSPEAKAALFTETHLNDLDQLAKLSEGIKRLGKDANHSNTAHHMAMWSLITGSAGAAPATHGLSLLAIPATFAGGKLSSLLFTNPQAARLLVELSQAGEVNEVKRLMVKILALASTNPQLSDAFATLGGDQN